MLIIKNLTDFSGDDGRLILDPVPIREDGVLKRDVMIMMIKMIIESVCIKVLRKTFPEFFDGLGWSLSLLKVCQKYLP